MGRNSQSPSSQNIFGVHHSSDPEERDRDSKTTTAPNHRDFHQRLHSDTCSLTK
ncbi:hypothetical protein M9458_021490, partial [Cirrhinus mrigala]